MEARELDELIEEPFKVPDLAELWPEILRAHEDMGFRIPLTNKEKGGQLTDNEMLREFQWIYSQYCKYIGTKRAPLLAMRGDLAKMLANVEDLIAKSSETPKDRTCLVYQKLRNDWLLKVWNHVAWIIEQQMEEKEDDGWTD